MSPDELKSAKRKYCLHAYHCKNKIDVQGNPVEMRLTFEQWIDVWLQSGHWHERGRKLGEYCMARINDVGHYELGNVQIVLGTENIKQAASRPLFGRRKQPKTDAKVLANARERMRRYRERLAVKCKV